MVVLIAWTAGEKEDLEHGKCQIGVVLTSSRQLTCVLAKISSEGFKIFSGIL